MKLLVYVEDRGWYWEVDRILAYIFTFDVGSFTGTKVRRPIFGLSAIY
jgi:hypothetical protein